MNDEQDKSAEAKSVQDGKDDANAAETAFTEKVGLMAARKLKAQRHVSRTIWSGLGMMGLVGWSVAVPTLLGATLGIWLDKHYPSEHSWALILLVVGLCLGCFNAWHWVDKEYKEIHRHDDGDNGE